MLLTGCTIRNVRLRFFPGFAAGVVLLTIVTAAWPQASLDVEPQLMMLGSFTAQDPAGNAPNPGTTTIRVTSSGPWSLYVTLVQPIRRVSDNLELPLERVRQYFADLSNLCSFLPVRLDYGPGDARAQVLEYDWQLAQARIAQYLDPADPPGAYRCAVRLELQDRDGVGMGPAVTLVMEFTVLPNIRVELMNPDLTCTVEHPGLPSESEPYYVMVRGNSAWVLEMQFGDDPVQETDPVHQIEREEVFWQVGAGEEWESYLTAFTPVGNHAVIAARGQAPAPFTLAEVVIPMQLRVETSRITVAGIYGSQIKFSVRADQLAR